MQTSDVKFAWVLVISFTFWSSYEQPAGYWCITATVSISSTGIGFIGKRQWAFTLSLTDRTLFSGQGFDFLLYTLNVNGLLGKILEVQNLLSKDQPHLLCLTETKLCPAVNDGLICAPGYSLLCRDHHRHGGGVAIYFKNDLQVQLIPESFQKELLIIKLTTRTMGLLLGCIYQPPSASVSFWAGLNEAIEDVLRLERKRPVLLLTGDLHVDVAYSEHLQRSHLETFFANHNLANHVKAPTRYSAT